MSMEDPFDALGALPDDLPSDGGGAGVGYPPDGGGPTVPVIAEGPLFEAAAQPLNDYGNGKRFVIHFGEDTMFVPRVGWFVWSGTHWEKDPDMLAVRSRAHKLSDLLIKEIPALTFGDHPALERMQVLKNLGKGGRSAEDALELDAISKTIARHRSFATTTGNSARIDNAAKEAGVSLAKAYDDLDAAPLDLNTESGVLRFRVDENEDGRKIGGAYELVPHDRGDRITKMMPVHFDANAPHPRFDDFLERIQPDPEMREFLQRWMGLSLTGLPVQRLAFFYGGGANGKSVLVDVIARIAGNYAATARIESLTGTNRRGGGDATPDLIPLMGARFVRTSEPDEGQRLQEGLIKELTGGEPLMVRALHSDFVEVQPKFKLTMSGNHKPDIRGTDDGIWRRMLLVPFDVQIPEAERDPELVSKLYEERSGILNWLILGLLDFLDVGLKPPELVTEATREYREESDPIGFFLTTCCVVSGDPSDSITSKNLGDAFTLHLMERGASPWKPTTFSRQISSKARQWRHPKTGAQFTKSKASIAQYVGLRLTDSFARRFDEAPRDQSGRPISVRSSSPHPDTDDFTG